MSLRLALLLLLCSCARMRRPSRVPEPTDPGNGGIVLSVTVREGKFQKHYARYAGFSRVRPGGRLEEDVFGSNYFDDDLIYLLDLPPGKYAPAGGAYLYSGAKTVFRFDVKVATAATVVVLPGRLSFAGDLQVKVSKDGAGRVAALVAIDRSREAEIGALSMARKSLAGTLWKESIDRDAMFAGPSRAPILDAKSRPIPEQSAPKYGYTDMLGWGKPVEITGGLEWREPKGHARIGLLYLSPGMDGYKSKEEYLEYMRSVGGPEDEHRISQVYFSSQTAYQVDYTTYYYPKGSLLGSEVTVYRTETMMAPRGDGLFLLHYRAKKEDFARFYDLFRRFRDSVRLPEPARKYDITP